DVHLAIGQLFDACGRRRRAMVWPRLQRFLERAHRHVTTHVNVPVENITNGSEEFFFWRCFHHVTVCACAEGTLCEDCFLECRIDNDQQLRFLCLERFYKFQTIAGTQPESCD